MDQWPMIDRQTIDGWVKTGSFRLPISNPIEAVEAASYAELVTGAQFEPDAMVGVATVEALHGALISQLIETVVSSDDGRMH